MSKDVNVLMDIESSMEKLYANNATDLVKIVMEPVNIIAQNVM